MQLRLSLVGLAVVSFLVPLSASCASCTPPEPVVVGDVCGSGTVDGQPYALDDEASRMIMVVYRNDLAGCGVFHHHAIRASVAQLEYELKGSDLAGSTVSITVPVSGLVPDDQDLREEFLPAGENGVVSDGDKASIRGTIADELLIAEHPELTFTLTNLSTATGNGTATLTSDFAGATSEVELEYTVTKDGDAFAVTGTADLDGAPHGFPRASLGFCINPILELHFDLRLKPGTAVCESGGPGDVYEPQFFDDAACAESVSYNEVRDVAVKSCAGCHAGELRLGATVPFIEWEDWRTDSLRNPGRPLYEAAHDYIHLDPADGLSMPPVDPVEPLTTPLTEDEIALFDAWVADGARNTKCADDPGPTTFTRVPPVACDDTIHYTSGADGNTAKAFFENNCGYCHLDVDGIYPQVPQVSALDGDGQPVVSPDGVGVVDFDVGNGSVFHPYYLGDDLTPLSFWQASLERVKDGSMPPAIGADAFDGDPGFEEFERWVNAGAPEAECAP